MLKLKAVGPHRVPYELSMNQCSMDISLCAEIRFPNIYMYLISTYFDTTSRRDLKYEIVKLKWREQSVKDISDFLLNLFEQSITQQLFHHEMIDLWKVNLFTVNLKCTLWGPTVAAHWGFNPAKPVAHFRYTVLHVRCTTLPGLRNNKHQICFSRSQQLTRQRIVKHLIIWMKWDGTERGGRPWWEKEIMMCRDYYRRRARYRNNKLWIWMLPTIKSSVSL